MRAFEQHLHDSGTGGYPLRDILDNLTDEDIEDSVKEFAQEYARQACEDLRKRIAENAMTEFECTCGSAYHCSCTHEVDKQSILEVEIILP